MKKIITVLIIMVISLAGCSGNDEIDYTDPQVYIDEIIDGFNEADEAYLNNINKALEFVIETDFESVLDTFLLPVFSVVEDLSDEQAETFYNEYTEQLDQYFTNNTESIQTNSEDLESVIGQFENLTDEAKEFVENIINSAVEQLDGVQEQINQQLEKFNEQISSFLETI